jgi:hypothetical protein
MREVGGVVAEGDDPFLKSDSLALKVWLHKPVFSSFGCRCESSIGRRLHNAWPLIARVERVGRRRLGKSTYILEFQENQAVCAMRPKDTRCFLKLAMGDWGPAVAEAERHSQLG